MKSEMRRIGFAVGWRTALVAGVWLAAGSVFAASFPAAVNGTLTLAVASGETTYEGALPSGVTTVVKRGSGCAVLAGASPSFAGQVEIREGTLRLTHINAVGSSGKLAVTGDAATLHLNFAAPSGAGQGTTFFAGHDITIRGRGADGKGALRWTPQGSGGDYDSMIDTLTLSGDAYLSVTHRYGFARGINLNGHALTRIDGTAAWMWNNSRCVVGAGIVSNLTGRITFQATPQFSESDKTTLCMAGGLLYLYAAQPIPCRVVMCGGEFEVGRGGEERNVFTGPFDVVKQTSIKVDATNKVVGLCGPTTLSANLTASGVGTLRLDGPLEMAAGKELYVSGAHVVCSSNVVRALKGLRLTSDASRFDVLGGVVTNTMLRVANAGGRATLVQAGGTLVNGVDSASFVGEAAGAYGAYLMSGGQSNLKGTVQDGSLHISSSATSEGVVWQTGGRMKLDTSKIRLGRAGRGFLGVFNGATNDTWISRFGQAVRLQLGDQAAGRGTLVVSGSESVVQSEVIVMGNVGVASTNLIAVTDGGTLKARRFYRHGDVADGSVNEVYVDGGVVMPTFAWNWTGVSLSDARLSRCNPNHWTIGPCGMVVDTSELLGGSAADDVASNPSAFPYSLSDAAGRGFASIALPTDNAAFAAETYCGPAFVDIEGPAGSYGAAAMAAFDPETRKLTHIVVMAPGCGYDETTKVYVRAAEATGRYECAYTLTDVRSGGALTKRGLYTLDLYGTNTYTGGTVVEGGTLRMIGAQSFPANTPLTVKDGGTFNNNSRTLAVSTLAGMGGAVTNCGSGVTVGEALKITVSELYAASGPLVVHAAVAFTDGVEVRVTDPENLPAHREDAPVAFLRATGGFTGPVPKLNLVAEDGASWKILRRMNELCLAPVKGLTVVIR